jgi:cytochrome c5
MKVFIKCNWVYGFVRVFISLTLMNMSACMSPENQYAAVEGQADQVVLSNEYFLGEELYKDNCAYCHEGGMLKAPH